MPLFFSPLPLSTRIHMIEKPNPQLLFLLGGIFFFGLARTGVFIPLTPPLPPHKGFSSVGLILLVYRVFLGGGD